MPQWLTYLLVFILGLLFTYIYQLFDLFITHLSNNATLNASKIQNEINNLSGNETPMLEPAIGFHVQNEDEEYYEEENKINKNIKEKI